MFSSTVIVASEENMSIVGEEDEITVALRSVTGGVDSTSVVAFLAEEPTWQQFSSSPLGISSSFNRRTPLGLW